MDNLKDKLIEYAETFNDNFPIYCFSNLDDKEIIEKIDKCLKDDKPIEAEDNGELLY